MEGIKTIEQIRNEIAAKYYFKDWEELVFNFVEVSCLITEFTKVENEVIQMVCLEQIKICALEAKKATTAELWNDKIQLKVMASPTPEIT